MKVPVLLRHEFSLPGAQSADVFIDYMNRAEARAPRAQKVDNYLEYMGNPAKGGNLFDVEGHLVEDVPRDEINRRIEEGVGLCKIVASYDAEWQKKHCPQGTEAERITVEGRYIKRLYEKATGDKDAIYLAAPHLNTDNGHTHWLVVGSKPAPRVTDRVYRLPAAYVREHKLLQTANSKPVKPGSYMGSHKKRNGQAAYLFDNLKRQLTKENHGAPAMIRSNFTVNPDGSIDFRISNSTKNHTEPPAVAQLVGLEERPEMKLSEKALRVCRDGIARELEEGREPSIKAREFARESAKSARDIANYSDPLVDRLDALIDKLQATGVPPSKWQFNNNQLAVLRPEIARLGRDVVRDHDRQGYAQATMWLSFESEEAQKSTNKDWNTRWGNAVLKVAQSRASDPGRVPPQTKRKKTRRVGARRPRRRALTPRVEHSIQSRAVKDSLTYTVMAALDWEAKKENLRVYYDLNHPKDEPIFADAYESVFGRESTTGR